MALSKCDIIINQQGRELLEHGTSLFPIACYDDNLAEMAVPWHWHDELEAIIIEIGTVTVSVDGNDYTVQQGDGFFINTGALHGVWAACSGNCRLHSLVYHPRLVGGSLDSIFWQKYLQPLLLNTGCRCLFLDHEVPWNREVLQTIKDVWQVCVSEPSGYEFEVRNILSKQIFLLAEHYTVPQKSPSAKSLRDTERMKLMLQYIQDHYQEELSTAKIAQSAAVSESECLRCFRCMIGTAPIQYTKQLRIQKAAELLESTDEKVSDIGALCGFQEMSYFAKSFREMKGCTPREYRKRHKR